MANVSFSWNGSGPDPDNDVVVLVVIMVMESPLTNYTVLLISMLHLIFG